MRLTDFSRLTACATAATIGLAALPLTAQVLSTGGSGPSGNSPNRGGGSGGGKQVLGSDMPFLDPSSGMVEWDGRTWNVMDNPAFEAGFERYLNSPTAESEEEIAYREILQKIRDALSPHQPGGPNMPKAVSMLPAAAQFPIDARHSDTLAQAIYGVWQGQKNTAKMEQLIREMGQRRKDLTWNAEIASTPRALAAPESEGKGKSDQSAEAQLAKYGRLADYVREMTEIEGKSKALDVQIALSTPARKMEYQALIMQFFLDRRFEHCILACRLYRQLFRDGDSSLQIEEGSDASKLFSNSAGMNPTINTLDTLSNKALRDIDEHLLAFDNLVIHEEYESASKRLAEAFLTGEYCSRVRTVPMAQKRKVLLFVRDAHMLRNSLEVKDYTLAEEIVTRMRETAKDFDHSKPTAAIETAKTVSSLHLNKAKVAALQGDTATVDAELTAAGTIWPTNPRMKEVSEMIMNSGDIKSQALLDLDRLIAQKNFRQVFNDQGRYAGAVVDDPARQEQLGKIIADVTEVNMMLASSEQLQKAGSDAAAWEAMRTAADKFPDDSEVNKRLSDLTTEVPEFVQALKKARELEGREQYGSSLSWYLKAKKQHPSSTLAKDGVARVLEDLRPHMKKYSSGSSGSSDSPPASRSSSSSASNSPKASPEDTTGPGAFGGNDDFDSF